MENKSGAVKIGVVLMTYGSATNAENVKAYMEHIYRGKVPDGIVADFEERYRLVGHSPLVEITEKQAKLLEGENKYLVRAGMLHSEPFIENAVGELRRAGVERLIGVILSPQFSSFIMDGYRSALVNAAEKNGFTKEAVVTAEPWPTEPHFIALLAGRIRTLLAKNTPVVFTTHSLPKRVVVKDPSYLEQLQATTDAILAELKNMGTIDFEWYSAYQSAGHTPEEWLKPDLTDILAKLRDEKKSGVLIVPIQFLTDHLEILYDLDIAARKQCEEFGIEYHRTELPNTDPLFIEALANIVGKSI